MSSGRVGVFRAPGQRANERVAPCPRGCMRPCARGQRSPHTSTSRHVAVVGVCWRLCATSAGIFPRNCLPSPPSISFLPVPRISFPLHLFLSHRTTPPLNPSPPAGVGDFTKINVPKGDAGGELDPHGACFLSFGWIFFVDGCRSRIPCRPIASPDHPHSLAVPPCRLHVTYNVVALSPHHIVYNIVACSRALLSTRAPSPTIPPSSIIASPKTACSLSSRHGRVDTYRRGREREPDRWARVFERVWADAADP